MKAFYPEGMWQLCWETGFPPGSGAKINVWDCADTRRQMSLGPLSVGSAQPVTTVEGPTWIQTATGLLGGGVFK
jgi:hypothetical protein